MTDRVEVVGGEARLLAGEPQGWIASEVISCPAGYRYDLVYLEAVKPGNSTVKISILDATKESSEIGFANETIPPHAKVNGTEQSVYDVSTSAFPRIRIQVNLEASGMDRPRLLAWSLHYVRADEWRDDFLGTVKMSSWRGLNVTGGTLEVNLTRGKGTGTTDYEAYPAIAVPFHEKVDILYPNTAHTGYQDPTSLSTVDVQRAAFGDLDGDGIMDLVAPEYSAEDSKIFWGSDSGTYSDTDTFELTTTWASGVSIGDFNGDGWNDIVFVWAFDFNNRGGLVFFNNGDGTFNSVADISMSGPQPGPLLSGDVNADGYDDILFMYDLFYCGPEGPGQTPDVTLTYWPQVMEDVNKDGYCDILTIGTEGIYCFLGSPTGIDTTADSTITNIPLYAQSWDAGDVNGDGYVDIVYIGHRFESPWPMDLIVYEGKEDGWENSTYHTVLSGVDISTPCVQVADIDKDGFDDILCSIDKGANTISTLSIYLGSSSWPSSPPVLTKDIPTGAVIIAIPKGGKEVKRFVGVFTTMAIDLPPGKKWDVLHIDGAFPQNTSMKFSVLDDSGKVIAGYKDLTGADVDLSGIKVATTIKVRVVLTSEFNWTTPVLERLTVNWMDTGTWREQFYGPAKFERTLDLGAVDGELARAGTAGTAPQLLFTALRGPNGYDVRSQSFRDGGGLDYTALPPIPFEAHGVSAVDAADVNGDGLTDVAFAVRQTADERYECQSLVFLGSSVGWRDEPDFTFPTKGASDVLLEDLNGDGNVDLVLAQEYDGFTYRVNSTLYWGNEGGGWNATPDVLFETNGASGVTAFDLQGDGLLDLAFSCCRDDDSTDTDSMVFAQFADGFHGNDPTFALPTRGARAVAAGYIDTDGRIDLAFANSLSGGKAEIDSYVYRGSMTGGFETTPIKLRTAGAEDVALADVDGDSDLDVVFANSRNNLGSHRVDSYVYLNRGSGSFSATPDVTLPTTGAVAIAIADLDGTGWRDLVFACQYDGASYNVSSVAYLGGISGWPSAPDIVLPTVGASDVLVGRLIAVGQGGYLSKTITPEVPHETGAFHTFRYTASLGPRQSGTVMLVDAATWAILARTPLQPGANEWVVKDLFWVKEHPSIRVLVAASGLDKAGEFALDDLWLNWTERTHQPPVIVDHGISSPSLLRMNGALLWLNITDEFDPAGILTVAIHHRLNGTADAWTQTMLGAPYYADGSWRASVFPKAFAAIGTYDLRVKVTDSDGMSTGDIVFPSALTVLNNVPTTPIVRIDPASPVTTSTLQAALVRTSTDVESGAFSYRYRWYKDGVLQDGLTTDTVLSTYTTRGENWSVEVRAFDGDDESLPGTAWAVIGNAAPFAKRALPNPELMEDAQDDQWLDLSGAFEDPDGDPLTWSVSPTPQHITVTIDPATGKVTLVPEANWNGDESITFIASDGLAQAIQTVLVTLTAVDDPPVFTTVNGQPITTDPITFSISQGQLLVIQLGTSDVEGDELSFSVNSTVVQINETTGEIRFQPGSDIAATLRFTVTMTEAQNPSVRVRLDFAITVANVNDPPADPQITNPKAGARYKVDTNLTLVGLCTDPDTVFGQVLNYTWSVNGTPRWYGSSVTVSFPQPGNYTITLTVSDGEFQRSASVNVTIYGLPPDQDDIPLEKKEGTPFGLIVGAVVAVGIVLLLVFMLISRRRAAELEAKDEAEEKKEAFKQMAAEVGATAAQMEREVAEAKAARPAAAAKPAEPQKVVMETVGPDGKVTVSAEAIPAPALAVQPKETEATSKETEKLFIGIEAAGQTVSMEEQEALRVENLKRKYQTAISRLPYGIPAEELKGRDWNELAAALATGQKRDTPDGHEITLIGGRWYYSDVKDASSFLKEHGAKPRADVGRATAPSGARPPTDRATLLAKLDERYILGEISEEKYEELKRKLEGEGK